MTERHREPGLEKSLMTLPMFLGSARAPHKAFVESAHCLWAPNPGATVLALMGSKVMVTGRSRTHLSMLHIKALNTLNSVDFEASSDALGALKKQGFNYTSSLPHLR